MPPLIPAAKLRPVAKYDDAAARHVLAAVVTHSLHHCEHAGVTDRETFAGNPAEIRFAVRIAP